MTKIESTQGNDTVRKSGYSASEDMPRTEGSDDGKGVWAGRDKEDDWWGKNQNFSWPKQILTRHLKQEWK